MKSITSTLFLLSTLTRVVYSFSTLPAFATTTTQKSSSSILQMSTIDAAAKQKYNKVFLAGGSKGVGRHILTNLVEAGSEVVALVRSADVAKELNQIEGVTAIQGDAFDYKTVEDNMDGCDAVVTTLGGAASEEEGAKRIDYEGNSNVIEAAGILGVTRVVLVTSIGCGDSQEAIPPSAYDVLKDSLAAKTRAENVLIKYYTNSNWTIIRPGGLKSEPATGTAILTEDNSVVGSVNREDVAGLVMKALTSEKAMRKVLSAIDLDLVGEPEKKAEVEVFAVE